MNRQVWIFMVICATAFEAGIGLGDEAPSQETDKELKVSFRKEQTNESIRKIKAALGGYQDLVNIIGRKSNLTEDYGVRVINPSDIPEDAQIVVRIDGKDLISCSSVGWEEQNIGFHNFVKYVEGYIEFQEYQNMKLRLELMSLKDAPKSEVDLLAGQLKAARKTLEDEYLGEGKWAD